MNRPLSALMIAVLLFTATSGPHAEEGQAPRGYIFFAPRNRPSATTKARVAEAKAGQKSSHADFKKTSGKTAENRSEVTAAPMPIPGQAAEPKVSQVTWGTVYGEGFMYPGPGPVGSYGTPIRTPLHGWRSTYNWGGHTYSMHCYCAKGYEGHCSGYRGECYRPCWNDAGQYGFEFNCRRGSPLDCFWHRGGYECPPRCTDCPYVCGTPSWSSYGFPPETYGAPTRSDQKPQMYYLPDGASGAPAPAPATRPTPTPKGPTLPPNPPEPAVTDPMPVPPDA